MGQASEVTLVEWGPEPELTDDNSLPPLLLFGDLTVTRVDNYWTLSVHGCVGMKRPSRATFTGLGAVNGQSVSLFPATGLSLVRSRILRRLRGLGQCSRHRYPGGSRMRHLRTWHSERFDRSETFEIKEYLHV